MSVYRVNNANSFGGHLYNYNKSIKLVNDMNNFFDLYNKYTDFKYDSYIKLLKEREMISHYIRFRRISTADCCNKNGKATWILYCSVRLFDR